MRYHKSNNQLIKKKEIITYWDHEDDSNDVSLISRLRVIQEVSVDVKDGQGSGSNGAQECYEDIEKGHRFTTHFFFLELTNQIQTHN